MSRYPILVPRYSDHFPPDTAICIGTCGREWKGHELPRDPAEGEPEELGVECSCGGVVVFKYLEAPQCPGCGKLGGYSSHALGGCCSRRCQLQAEYAAALKARST